MDSHSILQLYRQATAQPKAAFMRFALQLLQQQVRHESVIFGKGHLQQPDASASVLLVPLEVHSLAIDPAGIDAWRQINRADKAIPVALAAPGRTHAFHAPTLFAAPQDAPMRDYARRFRRQSYLITALTSPRAAVLEWCSLYRPDPEDLFSDADRHRAQLAQAHIQQALRVNTLLERTPAERPGPAAADGMPWGEALITPQGHIVKADQGFESMCTTAWPQFDGQRLPATVAASLRETGAVRFGPLRIAAQALGTLLLARARLMDGPSPLPPRRQAIAALFAQGQTTKEIARSLGIAQATVRTQLQTAYRQLGVGTRAGLRAALHRLGVE